MKKRLILILSLIAVVAVMVCLYGCSKGSLIDMTGKTAVVYELEGGIYKNCTGNFKHYYDIAENETALIYEPVKLTGAKLEKLGYDFDGWYQQKIVVPNADFSIAVLGELKSKTDGSVEFTKAELPLEEGKEYCFQIDQTILGKKLYLTNQTETVSENVLLVTEEDADSAMKIYVEQAGNDYKLYYLFNDAKNYLSYEIADETYLNFAFVLEEAKSWSYDGEKSSFKTTDTINLKGKSSHQFYFGTMENSDNVKFSENVGLYYNVEHVDYRNEWNFDSKTIKKDDNLTLYAKWSPIVKYTYRVCYIDEKTNETKVIGSYIVEEGEKFDDFLKYVEKGRNGWTALGTTDKNGNPWNSDFKHPGGDESTAVDVFVEYIEGEFEFCSTVEDLVKTLASDKGVYLMNDIDCEGATLNFRNYANRHIRGNGFTISNFNVGYDGGINGLDNDKLLNASILGNAFKANISDITFENVTLSYNSTFSKAQGIVIGVLASRIENVEISNVKVKNMTITIKQIPNNMTLEDVTIVADELYAENLRNSVIEGDCSVENIVIEYKVEENK